MIELISLAWEHGESRGARLLIVLSIFSNLAALSLLLFGARFFYEEDHMPCTKAVALLFFVFAMLGNVVVYHLLKDFAIPIPSPVLNFGGGFPEIPEIP